MLYDKLREYSAGGAYPMHMPGHKRNSELLPPGLPYDIDITEIYGFDDLHEPGGILLETAQVASGLYGSLKAFPLINGTTVGVLAAIGAHTKRGDRILASSDCHRSVANAASLFGLSPVFIEPSADPETGVPRGMELSAVEAALRRDPGIALIVATSPSYEGIVSDVAAIADIAHSRGRALFVDGAHGAHLGFSPGFPESAVRLGADVVVMSLHKTLPALTQCSLLHICSERADAVEVKRLLSILQTSSPSYVLMASIDCCLRLLSAENESLFLQYRKNLEAFDERVGGLEKLIVPCHGRDGTDAGNGRRGTARGFFDYDPGKIVVSGKRASVSGRALADALRFEHRIELEAARQDYAIAMTSVCDTADGLLRLADALCAIDREL